MNASVLGLPWRVDSDMRPGNDHIYDAAGNRVCFMANDGTAANTRGEARAAYLVEAANAYKPDFANPREPLPHRRTGGSIDFHWQNGWATYTVGFTLYPGTYRAAEIFLNVAKSEGMAEANARDAGILASFALQHGAPLERLVAAVTHEADGSASSIVGTALNLVAAEIQRLRDGDADNPVPGVPPQPTDGPGHDAASAPVPDPQPAGGA